MIFKTFNNDIDKWTAKIGIFGKSFNELGTAVGNAFKATIDNIDNFDEDVGFWESLKNNLFSKNNSDKDWIKNSLGEIISQENIDSYIAELKPDKAREKLKDIFDWKNIIDDNSNDKTWQDYFDTLKDGSEKYIPDLIKNTDDLSKLTGDDLVQANQKARESALAQNAALKQQTLGAKAATIGMKAFAMAGNMAAMWAITKGIELAANAIDEAIVTNEEYLEQQDEIISKAEETISATESRISALEGLQEKLETTNGVQSEMLKLSKDINTVLGDGKSKILGQASAYEVLNAQIQQSIDFEKRMQNEANKDKRNAALNKAKNITFTEKSQGDDVTLNELKSHYYYFSRNTGDPLNPFDTTDTKHKFSDSIEKHLGRQNEKFKGEILTLEQLIDTYEDAIDDYNDYGNDNFYGGTTISISRKELESGFEEQIELLYEGLDDIINNGEGFLSNVNKKGIIQSMFVANGGIVDQEFVDNVYATLSTLDGMGDDVNTAFDKYNAALKDGISGNENEAYNQLIGIFDGLKEKTPGSVGVLNYYFDYIIATLKQGAADSEEEMSKINNIFDIDFTAKTESIDNFQSKLYSLGSTYSKLLNGNYTGSELIDMLQELQAAGTDLTTLESIQDLDEAILKLNTDNVNSLIKSLNINPTSDLADYLRTVADEAIKVTAALEGTTGALSNIQNGYTTLSGALEEYNENGFLTIDTLNKVLTLEPEYLSCLIDENGQLQLNKEAYMQLAIAQIEKAKQAVIDEAAVKMAQLAHEGLSVSTQVAEESQVHFANTLPLAVDRIRKSNYDLAISKIETAMRGVTGAQVEYEVVNGTTTIADVEKIYNRLSGIQQKYGEEIMSDMYTKLELMNASEDEMDSVFSSISGSSASKSSSSTSDNALDAIHKLIDLRIQMIKDMKQKEIDAIQKIIDAEKEKLDAIKETIDARKEAMQVLKEEEEHEDELAEKNKAVSDIQSQLDSLSRDNSASAAKKRRELEEELAEAQKDLSDYISDYEYDQAVDALDKEAEAAEKAYEEEEKRLQTQIDTIQDYIDNEKQLYQDAMNDLNGMSNKLFEDMKRWGEETTGEVWEVVNAWNAALEALQKYNAVNSVPQIHDELHEKDSNGGSGSGTPSKNTGGKKDKDKDKKNYKAIHKVRRLETIATITQKYYGNPSKWTKIRDANPNYFSSTDNKATAMQKCKELVGKKLYIPYKNGTLSVPRDSLALIDETGEELVLHANEHGKLTHLTKGSSVIPADITERLLAWAQNAPDVFSSNLRRHIPDLQRPDNRTWGKPTVTIGDIYINGNMGSLTRADLADFRKDIVNDVYESMQKNRVKSGRY